MYNNICFDINNIKYLNKMDISLIWFNELYKSQWSGTNSFGIVGEVQVQIQYNKYYFIIMHIISNIKFSM